MEKIGGLERERAVGIGKAAGTHMYRFCLACGIFHPKRRRWAQIYHAVEVDTQESAIDPDKDEDVAPFHD